MNQEKDIDEILGEDNTTEEDNDSGPEPSNEVVIDPDAPPSPNVDHSGEEYEKWGE